MKDYIFELVLIGFIAVMVFLLSAVIIASLSNPQKIEERGCDTYTNTTINNVPARCVKEFVNER